MSDAVFTIEEMRATFRPARFQLETFAGLIGLLPDIPAARLTDLTEAHQAAVGAISLADLVITAEVYGAGTTQPNQLQWYSSDEALIECCRFGDEVVTLSWPPDEALLASRIAVSIGFREDVAEGWVLDREVEPQRVPLTEPEVAALRAGEMPSRVAAAVGTAGTVVRLWSATADSPVAYDTTIILAGLGPWVLDPGDEPTLRALHPIELWGEIGTTISGLDPIAPG